MEKHLVSVIVPVYNTEEYLDKCITSILRQTYPNFELLLIDDGSTDNSLVICKKYRAQDKRVIVLEQENQGQAVARNLALDNMRGEFVLFVDSDDYIVPHTIERAIRTVDENGADLVVFGCQFDTGIRTVQRIVYQEKRVFDSKSLLKEYLTTNNVSSVLWDKFYASSLFNDIRFPRLRKNEDAYILPQIFGEMKKAVYIPEMLYTQIVRNDSTEQKPFSVDSLALLECEKELSRFVEGKYPEFLELIAYRYVNAQAGLIKRILHDFKYIQFRGQYRELSVNLSEEFERGVTFAHQNQQPSRDVTAILEQPHLFFVRETLRGIVIQVKKKIKGVLRRLKR